MGLMEIRRRILLAIATGGEPGMGWELIRHFVPTEDVNKISVTTDENGQSFSLKKALVVSRYRSSNTTTNNNEVVFSCRGDNTQFSGITNSNSSNSNGDAILIVEHDLFGMYASVEYSNNPITTGSVAGTFTRKASLSPNASAMSSFMMRQGNSNYTFDHEHTEIYIYGIRA